MLRKAVFLGNLTTIFLACASILGMEARSADADGGVVHIPQSVLDNARRDIATLKQDQAGIHGEIEANNAKIAQLEEMIRLTEQQIRLCLEFKTKGLLTPNYKYTPNCAKLGVE